MTKDNIMKLTDGLFHQVFDEIGQQYPEVAQEHLIIDIGMARVAKHPERFDVIVTPNLYGDILSDVTAEIAGSVGLAPSANIGRTCAMFEAIHGSAPDLAGRGVANPSGLLLAAVMMLVHVGQPSVAAAVHNAWSRTIEDGVHTADLAGASSGGQVVGTQAFADAVIGRLGLLPVKLPIAEYRAGSRQEMADTARRAPERKELVGIDVFVHWAGEVGPMAERLRACEAEGLALKLVTNRGVKVWPEGLPETFCTDHWRCRFLTGDGTTHASLVRLLGRLADAGVDFIKSENLCLFDGQPGYSLGQGQ